MRNVKIGYQLDFRNPPGSGRSFKDLYAQGLAQIETAEALGFDSVWLTEHHFTDDGYLPSMMIAASAIAARTRRVTIGTYVLLAPFQHPLKLAEDTAVVDVISGGRLRLGIGMGYRAEEFEGFGVARNERFGRTFETIEILRRAWTGERFDFHGKYFHLHNVRVLPAPVSKPHPELLWGAGMPKGMQRAVKLDMSFAWVGGRREINIYRDMLKAEGKDPAKYSVVSNRALFIADSEEQAWNETRDALMYQAELYGQWLRAAGSLAGSSREPIIRPDPERLRRTTVLGTPAQVIARLSEIIDTTPMTELIIVCQLPGLDPAKAHRSLERFGKEVLPAIRAA